jgi:hypothetical protein
MTTIDLSKLDTIQSRFWSKVARRDIDECWEWQAHCVDGYGVLKVDGRDMKAHRISWLLASGSDQIPAGHVVMHSCDNPPCVNPAHLSVGTVADNNSDRHTKGRTVMPTDGPEFWRNKTHCPRNHPYSGDNLRLRPNGRRRCAQCYRDRAAAYAAANRDQINARKRAARAAKRSS